MRVRLDVMLAERGLAESREKAQALVLAGEVLVNGVKARGGSIDGPGAVIVNGMVFVNSGYSRFGGIAGNVLLAFAP